MSPPPSRRHLAFSFIAVLAVFPTTCRAYPSYAFNISNGGRVACPPAASGFDVSTCEQHDGEDGAWCSGVGHGTCKGGSMPLNPFGAALKEHGYEWTKELCETDSDGDGLSNGEELGDPCCTWKRGDAPSPYQAAWAKTGASHPGVPHTYSYTPPNCDAAEMRSPNVATARSQFNDHEERRNITWRIRDFQLPRERTTYINVVFNIDEPENVEIHEEYHIVYGEAIVDQPEHLHHFVVKGCNKKIDPSLEGRALENTADGIDFLDNCEEPIGGFWAPGPRPMWDITTNQGVRIGTAANVVAITVNIHYTDGDKVDKSTDIYPTDGITMYYTPNLRPKTHVFTNLINFVGQGEVVRVGNTDAIRVPAGKKRWYLTRRCTVGDRCKDASQEEVKGLTGGRSDSCRPLCRLGSNGQKLCPETCGRPGGCTGGGKSVRVMGSFFHAHLLGTEMYQSVIKKDTGAHIDLGSMRHWSYEDETVVPLDGMGLELAVGDILLSTCVYDTQHMTEATKFGRETYDEMCLNSVGVELDTADKHYGAAFSCEGAVWSGELGEHQSALTIHAPETLLATSSDCWSSIGHGLDCKNVNSVLEKEETEGTAGNTGESEDDDDTTDDVGISSASCRATEPVMGVAMAVAVVVAATFRFRT